MTVKRTVLTPEVKIKYEVACVAGGISSPSALMQDLQEIPPEAKLDEIIQREAACSLVFIERRSIE